MKRKTAREILVDAFREVAGSKDVDKITVKDITENCGYSTATFYRHFRDKYDLIVWSYTQAVTATMGQIGREGYTWAHTLLEGARFFDRHRDVLANLLLHTSGHDAFVQHMSEVNYQALKDHVLKSTGREALDVTTDMYVRMYCMGTVCLTCEWILGRYPISPEELAEVYKACLPKPLHPLLLRDETN